MEEQYRKLLQATLEVEAFFEDFDDYFQVSDYDIWKEHDNNEPEHGSVTVFDFSNAEKAQITELNSSTELRHYFSKPSPALSSSSSTVQPSKPARRLFVLEGLDPRLVDVLGSQLGVPPMVFISQAASPGTIDLTDADGFLHDPAQYWNVQVQQLHKLSDGFYNAHRGGSFWNGGATPQAPRRHLRQARLLVVLHPAPRLLLEHQTQLRVLGRPPPRRPRLARHRLRKHRPQIPQKPDRQPRLHRPPRREGPPPRPQRTHARPPARPEPMVVAAAKAIADDHARAPRRPVHALPARRDGGSGVRGGVLQGRRVLAVGDGDSLPGVALHRAVGRGGVSLVPPPRRAVAACGFSEDGGSAVGHAAGEEGFF